MLEDARFRQNRGNQKSQTTLHHCDGGNQTRSIPYIMYIIIIHRYQLSIINSKANQHTTRTNRTSRTITPKQNKTKQSDAHSFPILNSIDLDLDCGLSVCYPHPHVHLHFVISSVRICKPILQWKQIMRMQSRGPSNRLKNRF